MGAKMVFNVAPDDAPDGAILYFQPAQLAVTIRARDILKPGELLSQRALAWRLAAQNGVERKKGNPPGSYTKQAVELAKAWVESGEALEAEGDRNAKCVVLPVATGEQPHDLATSPAPRPSDQARSQGKERPKQATYLMSIPWATETADHAQEPHLASSPIKAREGEVREVPAPPDGDDTGPNRDGEPS